MLEEVTLQNELKGYNVRLKQVQKEDLEVIRGWRNDHDVKKFMISQDEISSEQQSAWFRHITDDRRQQHFVVYYKDYPIGSTNIKTFYQTETLTKARALELGIYIAEQKYRNNILAFAPSLLMIDYCFYRLKTKLLTAIVKAENQAALKYNYALGYENSARRTKQGCDLIEITLKQDEYEQKVASIKRLLSR